MKTSLTDMPSWVPNVLKAAAIYNLLWGAFVVLFPLVPFAWMNLEPPNYPSIVQCLGMVIGVYGIGYWISARDPETHWPIILVGLLGKIFGPIGVVYAASIGELPWRMGVTILTNDLAWWIPFAAILLQSARAKEARRANADGFTLKQALESSSTQNGSNLLELSNQSPLLLVCVRHFGCTFCREMLNDLARQRDKVNQAGLTPVIISMGTHEQAQPLLERYGLSDVAHVSDPNRILYRALELPFGTLGQLFGWFALWRAFVEGALFRFGFGAIVGNPLQLSGAVVVQNGRIVQIHRHATSADRTNFSELTCKIG